MPSKKYILARFRELEDKLKILKADIEEHYKLEVDTSIDLYSIGYKDGLKKVSDFIYTKLEDKK